ncbi:Extracellular solute-binding protein family 3 [Desulfamplus magnetovallimortis]|uniref:Extracellular solute-binding protein family 3 n=1 Tax=Desulfamplus magnetovallimortis TaxID=1246637 RepID=A0A1W1HD11_9BACT|nr:transporter substrate-binding domain-containing protein [Desulfamplus magnetovallimortis]SLM30282.1 Extracellular solute-binding protein family 3 [Desulfamplus magnetovallimortis]
MRSKVYTLLVLFTLSLYCSFFNLVNAEAQPVLKLATQDFPPFSYLNNADANGKVSITNVAGPAAEIIRKVCEDAGIECTLSLLPWRRAQYDMEEEGLYNGLFLIGKNKARMKYLYFSPAVLKTEYGFFVKDDNTMEYKSPSDIKDYRVAVYGPSNTSKSLEKVHNEMEQFTIDMRPDDISGFRKLSLGRVEAVYSNKDVGFAILEKQKIKNIRYAGMHRELNYYIGFSMKHTDKSIVDNFNKTFLKLHKENIIQEILSKYALEPAVTKE